MKKIATILLLLLYLPAVSGVAISSFICNGEVISFKVQLETENPNYSSQSPNKDCCNNFQHVFKIHAPQQISVNDISCDAPVLNIPFCFDVSNLYVFFSEKNNSVRFNIIASSPPPVLRVPLFLRKSSFLI